jgi:hypothetical protein
MSKPARKPTESPNPTEVFKQADTAPDSGIKLVIGTQHLVPTEEVTIWTFGQQFHGHEKMVGTQEQIEAKVNEILKEGYQYTTGKKTVIYPPHAVIRIEVVRD